MSSEFDTLGAEFVKSVMAGLGFRETEDGWTSDTAGVVFEAGHEPAAEALESASWARIVIEAKLAGLIDVDDERAEEVRVLLAASLRKGSGVGAEAAALSKLGFEYETARSLAWTITSWAMNRASLANYIEDGLTHYRLLTAADSCPLCRALRDSGPFPLSDTVAAPPIHQRCRCAASSDVGY